MPATEAPPLPDTLSATQIERVALLLKHAEDAYAAGAARPTAGCCRRLCGAERCAVGAAIPDFGADLPAGYVEYRFMAEASHRFGVTRANLDALTHGFDCGYGPPGGTTENDPVWRLAHAFGVRMWLLYGR